MINGIMSAEQPEVDSAAHPTVIVTGGSGPKHAPITHFSSLIAHHNCNQLVSSPPFSRFARFSVRAGWKRDPLVCGRRPGSRQPQELDVQLGLSLIARWGLDVSFSPSSALVQTHCGLSEQQRTKSAPA